MPKIADILIVGAGFSGATIANLAAENGITVHLIDKRNHIGGNCYTYTDNETGVEVHKYGPHIFHTSSKEIWNYVNKFSKFNNYINRVKAKSGGRIFQLPINLYTINQFFNKSFSPTEAQQYINSIKIPHINIKNFEEFMLDAVGRELYEAFFKNYTIKQWGKEPKNISVSTAKRLPIRYYYDDNYYTDVYQGIPVDGYTKLIERMLAKKEIKVDINTMFDNSFKDWRLNYKKLVFTGSVDEFFNYSEGFLPYRRVCFEEIRGIEIQGTAVINYTDMSEPFTRIHEHKWFTPEKSFNKSIAFKEFSTDTDSRSEAYYPVRDSSSEELLAKYNNLAANEKDVVFAGRLAEFIYYDMHQVIGAAMTKFKKLANELLK